MSKRSNHYEAAVEAYLRSERIPYVAVNERRRALCPGGASLKSVDLIVSPGADPWGVSAADDGPPEGCTPEGWEWDRQYVAAAGTTWLVDVKGRRFPSGSGKGSYWKNWATAEDLKSLAEWRDRFGPGAEGALVFAYHLVADRSPAPPEEVFWYGERPYAFIAVTLSDYARMARPLSPRWGTVHAPVADFRREARTLRSLIVGLPRPRRQGSIGLPCT